MTVWTSGVLPRYSPATYNRPAIALVETGNYDVSAPYQRESVWGIEQRRALIKSLQMGLPVGAVWTNRRNYIDPYAVIDGRQRIETLRAWVSNLFTVPADWFDAADIASRTDDGDYIGYNDLTERGRRHCQNGWAIGEHHVQGLTVQQEAELYLLVNFGGTPQAEADRRRAEQVVRGDL